MSNPYADIKYDHSFLKQVIFRIDFATPLTNDEIFDEKNVAVIEAEFPKPGMQRLIRYGGIELQLTSEGVNNRISPNAEGRELTYSDSSQKNKIVASNLALVFEYNNYNSYEEMFSSVRNIVYQVWSQKSILTNRIGMRYVNLYNLDNTQPKIKKTMFVSGIRGAFNKDALKCDKRIEPLRSMTTLEYKRDDIYINYRHGLYNKMYPAKINKDDFVLDIDCFTTTGIDNPADIFAFMNTAHDSIQALFESSITEEMRKVMHNNAE